MDPGIHHQLFFGTLYINLPPSSDRTRATMPPHLRPQPDLPAPDLAARGPRPVTPSVAVDPLRRAQLRWPCYARDVAPLSSPDGVGLSFHDSRRHPSSYSSFRLTGYTRAWSRVGCHRSSTVTQALLPPHPDPANSAPLERVVTVEDFSRCSAATRSCAVPWRQWCGSIRWIQLQVLPRRRPLIRAAVRLHPHLPCLAAERGGTRRFVWHAVWVIVGCSSL